MPDSQTGRGAVLTALVMLISLSVSSCQLLRSGDVDEATRLYQSAGEDIREIEKLVQENKDKESAATRALNAEDYDSARRIIDDSIKAIDRGMEKAESAADKFDKASRLNIGQTVKEYLSLRAQSVNKAIEAFKQLRHGILTFRETTGSKNKAANDKAKNELQQSVEAYDKLMSESAKLERQADDIARRNPDTIKPG